MPNVSVFYVSVSLFSMAVLLFGVWLAFFHDRPSAQINSGDEPSMLRLSNGQGAAMGLCASRMGVTPEMALEMAVNRFQIAVMQLKEGNLANVDFRQSLKGSDAVLGPDAVSTSMPAGFRN